MKPKHYVYACVGLRPSERQEVVRLIQEVSPQAAHLRQANAREIPDFWIVNGDEPSSLAQVQGEGAVHVLEVSSFLPTVGGLHCLKRPFEVVQSNLVLRNFWGTMPEPISDKFSSLMDATGEVANGLPVSWRDRDEDDEREVSNFQQRFGTYSETELSSRIDTEAMELTPSELAMTEDNPDELAALRRAAVERMNSVTLDPFTDGMDLSQEWLDVMPAQILVLTELGERSRTLPKGLRQMGFGVDVIDGFDVALNRLQSSDYKVVFLDQGAAGHNLLDWCKALLKTANVSGSVVKVVVVGRKRAPWDRWRAMRAGCAAWMMVPLDRRELLTFLTGQNIERSLPRDV